MGNLPQQMFASRTLKILAMRLWSIINPLMYGAFAIELSDLSKPFKFARLKGFERLEGTYARF